MSNLPFPISEYERRITGVRDILEQKNLDALIISIHWNAHYLTGLGVTPHHHKLIIVPQEGEMIGVAREIDSTGAKATSLVKSWIPWKDAGDPAYMSLNPANAAVEALRELNLEGKRIGIETGIPRFINHMTVRQLEYLKKLMPKTQFIDDENIVMDLRIIKSDTEIACMRRAAVITERAALEAIEHIQPGRSQAEAYAATTKRAWSHNECDDLVLYLQPGRSGALIHVSGLGQINLIHPGDMVFMEIGASVNSYYNTRIRTISVGEPAMGAKKIVSAILNGLNKAIEFIRPGITSGEVDRAFKEEIAKSGYDGHIKHRLGYSLGLGWNEGEVLSLRAGDQTLLKPGMVFHVVPGIWTPELGFGVSFSENVLVTNDGSETIDAGLLERKLYIK